jgi:hypothetical protein
MNAELITVNIPRRLSALSAKTPALFLPETKAEERLVE